MKFFCFILLLPFWVCNLFSQTYPTFGLPIPVSIGGWAQDAMEPFISPDGNTLYFNSINSGGNTNLYSATRVNDSIFIFSGLMEGTYEATADHLDAVASLDNHNRFYWVSLRGYPEVMENLQVGTLAEGKVNNLSRVYGDFNTYEFNYPLGWLIMDAAINDQGDQLYYCNALFDFSNTICKGIPCKARLGIANYKNDTVFQKLDVSDQYLAEVNDTNYLVYAPQLSQHGLELYFTRMKSDGFNSEICVSVRNSQEEAFSKPRVIWSKEGYMPEAPTLDANGKNLWFHQKNNNNLYQIYLMKRSGSDNTNEVLSDRCFKVWPNPADDRLNISFPEDEQTFTISLHTITGKLVWEGANVHCIDISALKAGIYLLKIHGKDQNYISRINIL